MMKSADDDRNIWEESKQTSLEVHCAGAICHGSRQRPTCVCSVAFFGPVLMAVTVGSSRVTPLLIKAGSKTPAGTGALVMVLA